MSPTPKVYTVSRTDYDDRRDIQGVSEIVGVYTTLESANRAARRHCQEEAAEPLMLNNNLQVDTCTNTFGGFESTVFTDYTGDDDRDCFEVKVLEHCLRGPQRPVTPAVTPLSPPPTAQGANGPIHSVFGPMMSVPIGVPGALNGAFFTLAGDLWTMSKRTFYNTVKIYGGICPNYHEETDYVVIGANVTDTELDWFKEKSIQVIDEREFFELLKGGIRSGKLDDEEEGYVQYKPSYHVEGVRILENGIDNWLSSSYSSGPDDSPPAKRQRVDSVRVDESIVA